MINLFLNHTNNACIKFVFKLKLNSVHLFNKLLRIQLLNFSTIVVG